MKQHADSHIDHHLTPAQLAYLLERFADRAAFFLETIELPPELGTVPCGLHGPIVGDPPVPANEVFMGVRGTRAWSSRIVDRAPKPSRLVTVIAGPHDGQPCVLFTAYGGPPAPKEPGDPTLLADARPASDAFWAEHALSR